VRCFLLRAPSPLVSILAFNGRATAPSQSYLCYSDLEAMKTTSYLIPLVTILILAAALTACDSFLDHDPSGVLSEEQIDSPESLDGLIIAAYSALGNDHWTVPFSNMWMYGSVRSDDALKGGGGTGDIGGYNNYELFTFADPDQGEADVLWTRLYFGISRANSALSALNAIDEVDFPDRTTRKAEMRFIRGHFYFQLKRSFKYIPHFDESVDEADIPEISNRELSDQELWSRIADDFRFAAENLPPTQSDIGRPNENAARAYLAKTLLYQAYEQDDQHQVVGIDTEVLDEVVNQTDEVINSGQYQLSPDIADNFLQSHDNGPESVFAVQRSMDDGTPEGRVDMASGLNYPMSGGFGCCWFHIPSQNLVNAFQTDENGAPLFDAFNDGFFREADDFQNDTFDPRLNHTVSIPGAPFKYDPNLIYDEGWARTPQIYGPFSSMRELQHPESGAVTQVGPFFGSSKNTEIIRFADVLLWQAEALIELGRQGEALELINEVRERAQNSTGRLVDAEGNPVANYNVEPYQVGVNIDGSQESVREALRWERRLEFAMEGERFFDLVRWGIAAETLNDYFDVERTRYEYLQDAQFQVGRDEYLPIPQQQIDFSRGVYEQNTGW